MNNPLPSPTHDPEASLRACTGQTAWRRLGGDPTRQIREDIQRLCHLESYRMGPPKVFISDSGDFEIINPEPSQQFKDAMEFLNSLLIKSMRVPHSVEYPW